MLKMSSCAHLPSERMCSKNELMRSSHSCALNELMRSLTFRAHVLDCEVRKDAVKGVWGGVGNCVAVWGRCGGKRKN